MKCKLFKFDTILERLYANGVSRFDIDVRYLRKWIDIHPECFPKFMRGNDYRINFNADLLRWEIYKTI